MTGISTYATSLRIWLLVLLGVLATAVLARYAVTSPSTALVLAGIPLATLAALRLRYPWVLAITAGLLCVPLVPGPLGGLPAGVLMVGFALISGLMQRSFAKEGRAHAVTIAVCLLAALSATVSTLFGNTAGSDIELLSLLAGTAWVAVVVSSRLTAGEAIGILRAVTLGMGAVAALGLVQYYNPAFKLPATPLGQEFAYSLGASTYIRFGGPVTDYELYGELMMMAVLFAAYLALVSSTWKARVVWTALGAVCGINLLLTGTRAALVLGVLGVLALLAFSRARLVSRLWMGLCATAVLSAGAGILAFATQASGLGIRNTVAGGLLGSFQNERLDVWNLYLRDAGGSAVSLIGNGARFPNELFGTYPHSLVLTLLYTVGIGGTAVVLYLLLGPAALALRRWRTPHAPFVLVCTAALFADEFKVEFLRLPFYTTTFFALLAVLWSLVFVQTRPVSAAGAATGKIRHRGRDQA